MSIEKKVVYAEVYCDGAQIITWLAIERRSVIKVIYGLSHDHPTHQELLEYAIDEDEVDSEDRVLGGGVINLKTGGTRGSFNFGNVEDLELEEVILGGFDRNFEIIWARVAW